MPTSIFRQHSSIQCFFCLSPTLPKDSRNFRCPTCGCWNRYDDKGEILSDEPAMHDEHMNSRSFAKRASPRKDRLPTVYNRSPFCHTCQTNQMLLVNLLSNYLPLPESPEYARRLEMLPAYEESLHIRYPTVCESCLPNVEEEIQKKDHMARTKALGGWLKESRGKELQRRISNTHKEKKKIGYGMLIWQVRGCLWLFSFLVSISSALGTALCYRLPTNLPSIQPALPVIVLASLFWTAWDPTYSSYKKSQLQGRDVRIKGKKQYIICQMAVWVIRLMTSIIVALRWYDKGYDLLNLYDPTSFWARVYFSMAFLAELSAFIISLAVLRVQHPPTIRLVNKNSHISSLSRSATPNPFTRDSTPMSNFPISQDADILAALSLSSQPVITHANPVFGHPSLHTKPPSPVVKQDVDTDEMDWTPTDGGSVPTKGNKSSFSQDNDAHWLRPQRFFAPEKPTGLESLFERTKLNDEPVSSNIPPRKSNLAALNWWWFCAVSLVPLTAVAYLAWKSMNGRHQVVVERLI